MVPRAEHGTDHHTRAATVGFPPPIHGTGGIGQPYAPPYTPPYAPPLGEGGEETGRPSGVVRRPQVGKFWKQVAVRPDLVLHHLPVFEDSHKGITGVIGERAATARKACCFQRASSANEARQSGHRSAAWDQASTNFPLRQDRLFATRKTHVACECKLASDAGRAAAD